MVASRKSIVGKLAGALGLMVILAVVAVNAVSAASLSVSLLTPAVDPYREVFFNIGENPNPDWRSVGWYPIYGARYLEFSWKRYPFAANTHGSYRVAIIQNRTPVGTQATWVERMISHHWADSENGTVFTMGPFLRGYDLCNNCPSRIVVSAETYDTVQDPVTGEWSIVYTPITKATVNPATGNIPNIAQESIVFVINTSTRYRCENTEDQGPECVLP